MDSGKDQKHPTPDESPLPFVAPCKALSLSAPLNWLKLGWRDLKAAPLLSLSCGFLMAMPIMLSLTLAWQFGGAWIVFTMLLGFVFAAPVGCVATYAVSAQLERGETPSLARTLRASFLRYIGTLMVFALVLLIISLIWVRAGSAVSIFLPVSESGGAQALILYAGILALVSSVFLAIVFAVSVFSLPMIMHRDVDAITALVTSVNAVLRNKNLMLVTLDTCQPCSKRSQK